MDIEAVRIFLRVVERGSFTAAAAQLGLPLATVSRRVKMLEQALGVRLLYRTTRRVSVTEAGRDYYERCLRAEEILEDADRAVRALRTEPEGVLRVSAPYSIGLIVLEPALGEFRRRFPKVQLLAHFDNSNPDPVTHGFDIALRTGPLPDSGYMVHQLGWSRARLAASPDYLDAAGRPASPQELSRHAILAMGDRSPLATWNLLHDDGATFALTQKPVLISNDSLTVIRQAVNGGGITLVSEQLMAHRLAQGALEIILPQWRRAEDIAVAAIFPNRATLDSKVRAFVDYAAEIFAPWRSVGEG